MQKEIYFKELAHMIMKSNKSKTCSVGQQARDPGKSQCCSSDLEGGQSWFYAELQLIGSGPPTLRRAIGFTQSLQI